MIGIEVLAGRDLNPGADVVEPSVDVLGELMIRRELPSVVMICPLDVGYGHAMKRGGWFKRLGNERPVLLRPHDLPALALNMFRNPRHLGGIAEGRSVAGHHESEPELAVAAWVCPPQRVAHHPDVNRQLKDGPYVHAHTTG